MPLRLLLIVWTMVVWLVAPDLRTAAQADAAEVDVIGAPAPIGFAEPADMAAHALHLRARSSLARKVIADDVNRLKANIAQVKHEHDVKRAESRARSLVS